MKPNYVLSTHFKCVNVQKVLEVLEKSGSVNFVINNIQELEPRDFDAIGLIVADRTESLPIS